MSTGSGTRVYVLGDNWLPGVGGLENHTAALTDRLSATVPVEILTSESNTEDHGNPAVPVRRFPVVGDAGYYEGVREHLLAAREQGPFVLHVMGFSYFWPEAQARLVQEVAHRTGCPVVLKVPTSGHALRYLTAEFRAARASVSAFVCLNSGVYREIRDGGVPAHRIVALPNGVDTRRFRVTDRAARAAARARHGVGPDETVALFVGRLTSQKRVDLLVDAVSAANAEGLRLLLVGPSDATYGPAFDTRGLPAGVTWLGATKSPERHYALADVYVSTSLAEGMPNSGLEAMASGLPLLVSDIPGHRELVHAGRNGWLVPPAVADFATALAQLPARERLEVMGEESRRRAETEFSLVSVTDRYLQLYRHVLAAASDGAGPAGIRTGRRDGEA
ncbi:glycosyltransferase family 4 protein [Streptomyces sp. PKU-EA00015]|uniref:glycosyltransferase family 4 protein n=1 Tax=Streptomyces sp. PKU-EA00015 TaxID=2748326 RepID=UPI0015A1D1C6|nr:glycosyltransferase family 4 protein [Streptomyces sp. PKU-EA00015]NWF25739.1 glycosyltransferase family 4 protein [Streptomyces sp. PKU-EA00015]